MALWRRDRAGTPAGPGLVHHSDAGSQYTSFQIGLYKTELIKPRKPWHGLADVELATAEWVDWFNNQRLHTAIGDIPPTSKRPTTTLNTSPNRRLESTHRASNDPGAVHPGNDGSDGTGRANRVVHRRRARPSKPPCRRASGRLPCRTSPTPGGSWRS
ncbi:integrase core domain-containing protein [Streptomyces lomondensis]